MKKANGKHNYLAVSLKLAKIILPGMNRKPRRPHPAKRIGDQLERRGVSRGNTGPMIADLVACGYVRRVDRGLYKATGKKLPR